MIIKKIVDPIKEALEGFDENKMYRQMMKHYKILQLVDDNGNWNSPELQNFSKELLPANITKNQISNFIDEMADLAAHNPYLISFLEAAENEKFDTFSKKVKEEGHSVFPDLIAFAMVLECMTKVMFDNPNITEICVDIFQKIRKEKNLLKNSNLFYKLKLHSVEASLKNIFFEALKTGIVPPTACRTMLSLNIIEATITDYLIGYKDNAKASWPLVVNRPGSKRYNVQTGAGPSKWSENKKGLCLFMPLPKEWADLYQTWNMAFVSHRPSNIYLLPKLVIPFVAKYQDKPEEYIHKRVLALYLTIYYTGLSKQQRIKNNEPTIEWIDQKLTNLWGKINLQSAGNYKAKLRKKNQNKITYI